MVSHEGGSDGEPQGWERWQGWEQRRGWKRWQRWVWPQGRRGVSMRVSRGEHEGVEGEHEGIKGEHEGWVRGQARGQVLVQDV